MQCIQHWYVKNHNNTAIINPSINTVYRKFFITIITIITNDYISNNYRNHYKGIKFLNTDFL